MAKEKVGLCDLITPKVLQILSPILAVVLIEQCTVENRICVPPHPHLLVPPLMPLPCR